MRFSSNGVTNMMLRLGEADWDPALRDALGRAADVAVEYLKDSADSHHGGGSGRMRDAIRAGKPAVSRIGAVVTVNLDDSPVWTKGGVRPGSTRKIARKGEAKRTWSMAEQGAELNYGSSRRAASGWFDNGAEQAWPEVERTLHETIEAWLARIAGVA